jgi:5S rRNA maturation endonuclease (ribonuclease M5)
MNRPAPIEVVLEALARAGCSPRGNTARCPAHDDRTPSLSVGESQDGRVLIYCHAGCDLVGDILPALKLSTADLFPAKWHCQDVVAVYEYETTPPTRIVRRTEKRFHIEHQQPDGTWAARSGGAEPVLYRRNEVLAEANRGGTVWIVEGEKDADALRSTGVVATTNIFGQGKWRKDYAADLKGAARVVIVADKDEVGYKHAKSVEESLLGIADEVVVVAAAAGKDASDHLAAGFGVEDFVPVPVAPAESAVADIHSEVSSPRKSKATALVRMALDRFRLGCSSDGTVFAVLLSGPNVALGMRGRGGLRSVLASMFYEAEGCAPGQNALTDAMQVLDGKAMAAEREPVAIRMASHADALVVDLGRADGKVVAITSDGWEVVERSPVLFRSSEAVGDLPLPVRTGCAGNGLLELRRLVNVSEADWHVLVAVLVAAIFPDLPHPVLFISGEQGMAKSWATKLIVRTIDGSETDVQSAPRNEDDWSVVASSSWTIALDNVTKIDPWLSDCICRASTGAQWRKRTLFTDSDVSILRIKRQVIMNGIDTPINRGDLAERVIRLDLEPIQHHLEDDEIERRFAEAHPRILAALFDLVAEVLAVLPNITIEKPPRMASFAKVVAAVDRVRGTEGLARYRMMVRAQVAAAAEGDPFAQALDRFLASRNPPSEWQGGATELLDGLRSFEPDRQDQLPKNGQVVGTALSRAATSLRAKGWQVEHSKSGSRRIWTLKRPAEEQEGREPAAPAVPIVPSGDTKDGWDTSDLPLLLDDDEFDDEGWNPDKELF